MAQKSRELSQFGSFLEIDNNNKNIGITTTSTPYIGIGTTNPTSKLHVVGNTYISGLVGIGTTNPTAPFGSAGIHISGSSLQIQSTAPNIFLTETDNSNNYYNLVVDSGVFGIRYNNNFPGPLQVNSSSVLIGSATSTGTASQLLQVSGGTYISGNTGIGTTNPTSKLHVVGNTNISGIISATGYYLNGSQLVNAAVQTWDISGSDIYRLNGNVGIGTSVPSQKLDVVGNVRSTTFTSTETILPPFTVSSTATVSNLSAGLLGGKSAPSGNIVGDTDTQTLTNKTLTSPGITSSTSINLGQNSTIIFEGSVIDANKTTLSVVDPTTNRTISFPNASGTVLTTGNLTDIPSGSITSSMILDGTIVNADISSGAGITYGKLSLSGSIVNADVSASAAIAYSKLNLSNSIVNADIAVGAAITNGKLANSTISGISLGSNLATLTFGTYLTGTSYNGSTATTIGLNASSNDTSGNTVVVRSNGDFTAKTITATDLVTTSDINLKDNVRTIQNAIEIINDIRGVKFDWKETQKSSVGVIAQEIEEVLPELIFGEETKTVNYNGLIGVLIEAVKELSQEVQELKSQLNK